MSVVLYAGQQLIRRGLIKRRFIKHGLTLGRTRKVLPPPLYKVGLIEPLPWGFDKLQYFQTILSLVESFDLLNKMRYILWVVALLEACDVTKHGWKNMHFHSKTAWPPATYDVLSRNHTNWPSLNLSQNSRKGLNKQLLKTSDADVLSSREKKSENPQRGVATNHHHHHLHHPCTSEG